MLNIENRLCYKCSKPLQVYSFPLDESESEVSTCCGGRTTTVVKKELITAQCHDCGITFQAHSISDINKIISRSRLTYLSKQIPTTISLLDEKYVNASQLLSLEGDIQVGNKHPQSPEHFKKLKEVFTKKLQNIEEELKNLE